MARPAATPAPQQAVEPGVIGGFCLGIIKVLGWLILGLVFSILAEWLGMTFWWPEEGTRHSRQMLEAELGYLEGSVPRSLMSADPAGFARRLADGFYHYGFEVTGIAIGVERLNAPAQPQDATLLKISRILYAPAAGYLLAAITIRRNTLDTGACG